MKGMLKVILHTLFYIIAIFALLTLIYVVSLTAKKLNPTNVSANTAKTGMIYAKTGYIFIGDSRTTGMNKAVDLENKEDTFVVAKSGMGYNWYIETGSVEVENIRNTHNEYDRWVYLFNLGVNDLSNIEKYKTLYTNLSKEATVYFVTVNPTDDSVGGVQCEDIDKFNKSMFDVTGNHYYINSYDYLLRVPGIEFDKRKDGMHYSDATYQKLYEFIMMAVEVHEFVEVNDERYSAFYYLYNFK